MLKRKWFAYALLVSLTVSASASFARDRDYREEVIRENIKAEEAIKEHPDLSRKEYRELMKKNREISQKEQKAAQKHDGKLTRKDRHRLNEAQDEVNYDLNNK